MVSGTCCCQLRSGSHPSTDGWTSEARTDGRLCPSRGVAGVVNWRQNLRCTLADRRQRDVVFDHSETHSVPWPSCNCRGWLLLALGALEIGKTHSRIRDLETSIFRAPHPPPRMHQRCVGPSCAWAVRSGLRQPMTTAYFHVVCALEGLWAAAAGLDVSIRTHELGVKRRSRADDLCIQKFGRTNRWYIGSKRSFPPRHFRFRTRGRGATALGACGGLGRPEHSLCARTSAATQPRWFNHDLTNDRRTTDDDSQTATARRPAPREFPPRYKWSCPSQIRGAPRVHGALLVIRTLCGWCWPSVASCAGVRLRGIWLPSVHQSLGSPSFIPSPSIHLHPDPQPPLSAQPSDTRSRCCTPPFIFQSTGAVRARS